MRIEGTATKPGSLSKGSLLVRMGFIGVVVGGTAILLAWAGGWLTPHALTPARFVDEFQALNGEHPGFRRNHAKGVCVSGYFESNGRGEALSKAVVFRAGRVPIVGRFSLGGGMPEQADEAHTVRGLGIQFALPNGEKWRTAMINLPVFPVRTPEEFYELLVATAPDAGTGKPDAAKVGAFFGKYAEAAKAHEVIMGQAPSSGFENTTFNSLNAFRFENASGARAWVRWSLKPSAEPGAATAGGNEGKNFLFDGLIQAMHRGPLQWHLMLTVAKPGDPTDDATQPWPADRDMIDAGTVTFDQIESDDTSATRDMNFDPLILPDGMAASDDPLLSARSAVYSQSFTRREGETKNPSAVTPAETEK